MQCVRCSHPLSPRADRCLRCFALNPGNHPGAFSQAVHDSGPAAPVSMALESDPPVAPVAVVFEDDRTPDAAITIPDARPEPRRPAPEPARAPEPRSQPRRDRRVPRAARLFAWCLDGAAVLALTCACAALALHKGHIRYPLDFLRDTAPLWLALLAAVCVAWSWVFTALTARTPGMALFGQRVQSVHGGPLTPTEALWRAVLSLPSAALGLSGFALALFDARGQTLHDKLCRAIVVID